MKQTKLYIAAVLLTLTVQSCEEFLDEPPADLMSGSAFYQSTAQINQGIIGIYADLRYLSDYEYGMMSEMRSDNSWVNPTPNGQRDYSDIGSFRAGEELATAESAWDTWYKVIYDANMAIKNINPSSDEEKQFLCEAKFLRGWAYFELSRLFGNIPVVLSPVSASEANATPQTDAKTVIETVVIPDLEAALELPERNAITDDMGTAVPEQGRADCVAAQAMLARVYMTLAGEPFGDTQAKTKAREYIDKVLEKKADYWAKTIDEWRKIWTPQTGKNQLPIFAIQYRTGGTGNPYIFNLVKQLAPSYTDGVGVRLMQNDVYVDMALRYEFDKVYTSGGKDLRGEGWSVIDGYEAEGNTVAYPTQTSTLTLADGTDVEVVSNAMYYKPLPSKPKMDYLGLTMSYSDLKDYNDWPVNFPVIRIEDIMLLKAELLAEEGNSEAMDIVNEIRERAGCDKIEATDKDEMTAAVRNERKIEFMGEGIRWFDQVRYGTWQEDTRALFARHNNPEGTDVSNLRDGRHYYAIPINQMNITPGLYKQNDGY